MVDVPASTGIGAIRATRRSPRSGAARDLGRGRRAAHSRISKAGSSKHDPPAIGQANDAVVAVLARDVHETGDISEDFPELVEDA
jgi:hypothetical protein